MTDLDVGRGLLTQEQWTTRFQRDQKPRKAAVAGTILKRSDL